MCGLGKCGPLGRASKQAGPWGLYCASGVSRAKGPSLRGVIGAGRARALCSSLQVRCLGVKRADASECGVVQIWGGGWCVLGKGSPPGQARRAGAYIERLVCQGQKARSSQGGAMCAERARRARCAAYVNT